MVVDSAQRRQVNLFKYFFLNIFHCFDDFSFMDLGHQALSDYQSANLHQPMLRKHLPGYSDRYFKNERVDCQLFVQ